MDEPDSEFDLTSDPDSSPEGKEEVDEGGRRFLGVHFACCNAYGRAYRDTSGVYFQGRCPKCYSMIRFVVGSGGRSETFFRAE